MQPKPFTSSSLYAHGIWLIMPDFGRRIRSHIIWMLLLSETKVFESHKNTRQVE